MLAVQLSLPFTATSKLNEHQKNNLITFQCKRLGIDEWEIESLLELCRAKGYLNKGLAIVYKYASYVDEIRRILTLFHKEIHSLKDDVPSGFTSSGSFAFHPQSLKEFYVQKILNIISWYIRLCYTLLQWRKLQFTPRPILIQLPGTEEDNNRKTLSISQYLIEQCQEVSQFIHDTIKLSTNHFSDKKLYSIFQQFFSLEKSVWNVHKTKPFRELLKDSLGDLTSGKSDIVTLLLQILALEEKCFEKWTRTPSSPSTPNALGTSMRSYREEQERSLSPISAAMFDTSDTRIDDEFQFQYTTLFLPYPQLKTVPKANKWFIKTFKQYDSWQGQLDAWLDDFLLTLTALNQLPIVREMVLTLPEEKYSVYINTCHSYEAFSGTTQTFHTPLFASHSPSGTSPTLLVSGGMPIPEDEDGSAHEEVLIVKMVPIIYQLPVLYSKKKAEYDRQQHRLRLQQARTPEKTPVNYSNDYSNNNSNNNKQFAKQYTNESALTMFSNSENTHPYAMHSEEEDTYPTPTTLPNPFPASPPQQAPYTFPPPQHTPQVDKSQEESARDISGEEEVPLLTARSVSPRTIPRVIQQPSKKEVEVTLVPSSVRNAVPEVS